MEALIRDFSLPQSERSPLTKEWKRRRFEVTALCLEVHRILKIRTPYSRILLPISKVSDSSGIEYFKVLESFEVLDS